MIPAADAPVAAAAKKVRVLSALAWPPELESTFLANWRAGTPELPKPPPVRALPDLGLRDLTIDRAHPMGAFVARTADSCETAAAMLAAAGTPDFTRYSVALYGSPTGGEGMSALEEAEQLLTTLSSLDVAPTPATLSSQEAQVYLQERIDTFFDGNLPVLLDPTLGSLATAGSKRVRLRDGVQWSEVQLEQLLQHEALVHAGTKRNGAAQPLRTLGVSSPRTTAVQEGLATVAELITDTLDIRRLRRIALRVRVVHLALEGADFIEVFEILLKSGMVASEAFRSAQRVFRGGDVRGGVAFTKDVVYLKGLREVHAFLLSALRNGRPDLVSVLFAGRMTTGDAVALAPFVADGTLCAPSIVPPWLQRMDRLAAYLAWTSFRQGIAQLELDSFD